jgi:hypothetical protein
MGGAADLARGRGRFFIDLLFASSGIEDQIVKLAGPVEVLLPHFRVSGLGARRWFLAPVVNR